MYGLGFAKSRRGICRGLGAPDASSAEP